MISRPFILLILFLQLAVTVSTTKAQDRYDALMPHLSIEDALAASRKAVKAEGFNPLMFEVHNADWVAKFKPDDNVEHHANNQHSGSMQVMAMVKEFGEGPFWRFEFWRTKRLSQTGNWDNDQRFGLIVLVYHAKKVAIIDTRTWKSPEDKFEKPAAVERNK
ncbi:hypothetical protein FEM03_09895 [Phragmitibacter flavus]|uniref:Nuclear transport factor 2 family protein n=1 Tax=Phragmitibacter flavus TaxID=2576071 RepID=A0A5R8KG01_9BACT|nr:hypothetical protein [Phragmitibacter flavus]TLD71206.1 hypothetical protein FEM03_09895 [Phragmitibacter flavus]